MIPARPVQAQRETSSRASSGGIGAQYTAYNKFNGATDNYDGAGRNANDNNTLFLYAWFAF